MQIARIIEKEIGNICISNRERESEGDIKHIERSYRKKKLCWSVKSYNNSR